MNTNNGNIKAMRDLLGDSMDKMSLPEQEEELKEMDNLPISLEEMTQKQKREKKVSMHDHKSKLGKQLTAIQQRKKVFGK